MFIQLSILTGALPNRWSCLSDGRSGSVKDLNAQTRVFRDRADFFKEGDEWLLSRFRLPRHLLMELCNALEPQLRRETRRSNAIPVPVQVCSTLGFFWPPGPFSGRSGTGLVFPSQVLAEPCQQFWQL